MSEPSGAAVVIIGGGVTGLSAGWWLARAGVDVLVLERGIVGWEASGRNGGGAMNGRLPAGCGGGAGWGFPRGMMGGMGGDGSMLRGENATSLDEFQLCLTAV